MNDNGLNTSLKYFLKTVKNKKKFINKDTLSSLRSNDLILRISKNCFLNKLKKNV